MFKKPRTQQPSSRSPGPQPPNSQPPAVSNNQLLTLTHLTKLNSHSLSKEIFLAQVQSRQQGLTPAEVKQRREQFGPNKLKEKQSFSVLGLFVSQFTDILILILMAAAVFSLMIGETIDAIAIAAIVIINGLLGFVQEYKAEKSIEALKHIGTPKARMMRAGKEVTIPAEEVVPGDILYLYEGEKIAADARLLEAHSLSVDESMLTGESVASSKDAELVLNHKTALADRKNMVFSGCVVTRGRAQAVVALTGMETQVGRIAQDIQTAPEELTPLQKALEKLGKALGFISLLIAVPGTLIGIITGRDWIEMMMLAVSLAVSAIPEGLPIVVTIALALGIKKMIKVNVLVRKLSAVESLGSTDVICSDKTGTITHNQMTIKTVVLPDFSFFSMSGEGYKIEGSLSFDAKSSRQFNFKKELNLKTDKSYQEKAMNFAEDLVLASDAVLNFGDPTERSLVVLGRKLGINEDQLRHQRSRLDEQPFDSANKFMAVLAKAKQVKANQGANALLVKGAPEVIFAMSKLSKTQREKLAAVNDHLTSQGLRVLALAGQTSKSSKLPKKITGLEFMGLVAMYDPPRVEVAAAVQICYRAGIRVVMITGDHKKTAQAIAQKIGLAGNDALTGAELDNLDDRKFKQIVEKVNVYARVAPRHKVRILTTLQSMGHQVAMTGDGVNDAPAVKRADVGITVGSGTDLTKEISDMVLLDDDFSTIAKAIREGRLIFFNIKKFVRFLLSANFDEIARIFTSIIFGLPLSLLPIHILWLNIATDSLPALALTADVAEPDIMDKKPYRPEKEILRGVIPFAMLASSIAYVVIFGLFLACLYLYGLSLRHAQTISFTATVLYELFLVFAIRSEKSVLNKNFFSNKFLWMSVLVAGLAQVVVIYHPTAQLVFKTVPLGVSDWVLVLLAAVSGLVIIEALKLVKGKVRE